MTDSKILRPEPKSIITPAHEEAARVLKIYADTVVARGKAECVAVVVQTPGGNVQSQVLLGNAPWAVMAFEVAKYSLLCQMIMSGGGNKDDGKS